MHLKVTRSSTSPHCHQVSASISLSTIADIKQAKSENIVGSGRNKTLNAHPRSLDQCLDTVHSSNQSILSVLYFRPVFSKPLIITFMLTIHTGKEVVEISCEKNGGDLRLLQIDWNLFIT